MKLRLNKSDILRHLLMAAAFLGIAHFAFSLAVWGLFGLWVPIFHWEDEPIDWLMFLHTIPTLGMFSASAAAFVLARRRKIQRATVTLGFVLIASVSWFFFETRNHLFQFSHPVQHIGNVYSLISVGERHFYYNWPWYEQVIPYSSMPNNYKYGYIDKTGRIVVKPQFAAARGFSEGLARVRIEGRWGYIDRTGKVAIEPQFLDAHAFSGGIAAVKADAKWGFVDKSGRFVISPRFDHPPQFSEALAVVTTNGKDGYIDKTGSIVIKPKFERASQFSEALAAVRVNRKWGYVDKTGQLVIEAKFDAADRFSEGFAAVKIDRKWGYINKSTSVVIEPKFDEARPFSEGVAAVEVDEKWGYIDNNGKFVVQPHFDQISRFSHGLAINHGGNWGYRSGFYVALYDEKKRSWLWTRFMKVPMSFSEGLAAVFVEDKWSFGRKGKYGYIDETCRIVIPAKFDTAGRFSEGLACVGIKVDE